MTSFFPDPTGDPPASGGPEPAVGNGFRTAGPAPRPPAPPRSRWAGSDVSFGPVGRILGTLVVLAIGVWLLTVSILSFFGAVIWWLVVTPWALRDLWRPVTRR